MPWDDDVTPPLVDAVSLDAKELVSLVRAVGITSTGAVAVAAAVALAESGGATYAINTNDDGSKDYGLWQINTKWNPQYKGKEPWLLTAAGNATAMAELSKMGTDWSPWSASTGTQRYKDFLVKTTDEAVGPAGTESLWDIPGAMGDKLDQTVFGSVPEAISAIWNAVSNVGWWKRLALGLAAIGIGFLALALIAEDALLPKGVTDIAKTLSPVPIP